MKITIEYNDDKDIIIREDDTNFEVIEFETIDYKDESINAINHIRRLAYILYDKIDLPRLKHSSHCLTIAPQPNDDETIDKVINLIGKDVYDKLYGNGYAIVRDDLL